MARLLIVDDEEPLRRALRHTLSRAGHDVLEAASVVGARDVLSREPGIELVFCDLGMPDGSGMELLRSLDGSDIAVVILTGHDDPALAETALAIGAYGYVVKPVSPNEIQISAATALRRRELELARRDYVHELENKVLRRTAALRDALDGLRESEANARMAAADTVDRLVSALALRNEETGAHIQRVGLYAAWLAAMTDICPWAEQEIRLAAMLHDVGKLGIPDSILLKAGPLDRNEYTIMKRHCRLGASLLEGTASPLLTLAAQISLTHHERWDGTGYPSGLAGDEIPLHGRIVAVADVFDALCSDRVYRPAMAIDDVLTIMQQDRGRHFDPQLLDRFLSSPDALSQIRASHPDAKPAPVKP